MKVNKAIRSVMIWYRANFSNWPYWRVTYKDGKNTFPLYYREAKGLEETFNGKLWIDYTIKI